MIHWTDIAGQLAQSNKFKLKSDKGVNTFSIFGFDGTGFEFWFEGGFEYSSKLKKCTLIARSFGDEDNPDDMTIEETNEYEKLLYMHWDDIKLRWGYSETPESFLYLISIGVLPPNVSIEGVEFITTNGE